MEFEERRPPGVRLRRAGFEAERARRVAIGQAQPRHRPDGEEPLPVPRFEALGVEARRAGFDIAGKARAPRRAAPGEQHRARHQRGTDGRARYAIDAARPRSDAAVDAHPREFVEIALQRFFGDELRPDHRFVMFEQSGSGDASVEIEPDDDVERLAAIAGGFGEVGGGEQVADNGAVAQGARDRRRALGRPRRVGAGERPGDRGRRESFGKRRFHPRTGRRKSRQHGGRRRRGGERARENEDGPGHLREASATTTGDGAAARGRPISRTSFSIIAAAKSS